MNEAEKYLAKIKSSIDDVNEMISLLERRIELGNQEMQIKSAYEANEMQISLLRTAREIDTLKKVLFEKTTYYEKFSKNFLKEYDECELNFDSLLESARKKEMKNAELRSFLSKLNVDKAKANPQAKVNVYKKIKTMMNV